MTVSGGIEEYQSLNTCRTALAQGCEESKQESADF